MSKTFRHLCAGVLAALVGLATAGADSARAEFMAALGRTSASFNVIYTFDSNPPAPAGAVGVTVSGLNPNVTLLSIDYRPSNGQLYSLGDDGGIYTINTNTGAATRVSTLSGASLTAGTPYEIDFNPVANALRVIGAATGQNLSVNVDTGIATAQAAINGTTLPVVGAAYSNNVAGASTTTLYDLTYNSSTTQLFLNTQTPPASGTVTQIAGTGIFTPSNLVGFDISGTTGLAYVAYNSSTSISANAVTLATIDLATGNISSSTPIDGIGFQVRGLSAITAAVPEPASLAMVGLGLAAVGGLALRRRSAR